MAKLIYLKPGDSPQKAIHRIKSVRNKQYFTISVAVNIFQGLYITLLLLKNYL